MTEAFSAFVEVWRQLVPAGIKVGAGAIPTSPLSPVIDLTAPGRDLSQDRQNEFYCGRVCAREALALFGVSSAELAMGTDRRPVWPTGYIGSITHTWKSWRGLCAAAVARTDEWSAIGIDAEFIGNIAATAWPAILTEQELEQIKAFPPNEREAEVTRRWCVKEAAVKAACLTLQPLEIETTEFAQGRYGFAQKTSKLKDWQVRTTLWNGVVCAAAATL